MFDTYLRRYIHVLIGATFFVPIVFGGGAFIFPFVFPKIVLFRTIVLLMLGGYALLVVSNRKVYLSRFTPMHIAILVYFLSFGISTLVGVDFIRSFWDNHERMLGFFTLLHYGAYYYIITTVVREWREWRWFFRVWLLAGGTIMLLGIVQKIQPEFLLNRGSDRVSATLGNAIYFGAYGMFLAFVSLLLFIKEQKRSWKIYALGIGLLSVVGMLISGTRGVFLGLLAGAVALCIGYMINMKDHPGIRRLLGGALVAGMLVFGILFAFRHTDTVRSIPTIGRLVNIANSNTLKTRFISWSIAVDAWKEKPIFGWGPNNYYYAFNKYYHPESLRFGYGETWFDNAHNATMNALAVQGIVGLFAYLGIFGVPIFFLWKRYKQGLLDLHTVNIGSAFLVSHFVQQLFVFESPTSYIYLFFFLAFLHNQLSIPAPFSHDPKARHPVSWGSVGVVGAAVLLAIHITDINPTRANMATLRALQAVYGNTNPVEAFEKAIIIPTPHRDDIHNDFARAVFAQLPKYTNAGENEQARALLDIAYKGLQENRILHPGDIRVHLQQAQLSQLAADFLGDHDRLFDAKQALEDAIQKSPKRQQLYYALSGVLFQMQQPAEAIQVLEKSITFDPVIAEGWWRIALIYKQMGMVDKAKEVLSQAQAAGANFDAQARSMVERINPPLKEGD